MLPCVGLVLLYFVMTRIVSVTTQVSFSTRSAVLGLNASKKESPPSSSKGQPSGFNDVVVVVIVIVELR